MPTKSRRRMILRVDPETLLYTCKHVGTRLAESKLPSDARVVGTEVDDRGDIVLTVESVEFAEIPEDRFYPEIVGVRFEAPSPFALITESPK